MDHTDDDEADHGTYSSNKYHNDEDDDGIGERATLTDQTIFTW